MRKLAGAQAGLQLAGRLTGRQALHVELILEQGSTQCEKATRVWLACNRHHLPDSQRTSWSHALKVLNAAAQRSLRAVHACRVLEATKRSSGILRHKQPMLKAARHLHLEDGQYGRWTVKIEEQLHCIT